MERKTEKQYKKFLIRLHRNDSRDLIEHIKKQPNKQKYFERLVYLDIKYDLKNTFKEIEDNNS